VRGLKHHGFKQLGCIGAVAAALVEEAVVANFVALFEALFDARQREADGRNRPHACITRCSWRGAGLPEALRRAQLWLRALTVEEEQRFLERHPPLAAEFGRRARLGIEVPSRRMPGTRTATSDCAVPDGADGGGESQPYAHPEFWAPFIPVGA
jgi:hypothetical protein